MFIWVTRIRNVLGDDRSFGFKAVHTLLALVSVGFAVGVWRVASRARDRSRA